jgi:hypothetical protein
MTGKSIADERPTLTEILEKRDILLELKEAINQRLVHCSEEEWLRVETLPVTGSSFPVTRLTRHCDPASEMRTPSPQISRENSGKDTSECWEQQIDALPQAVPCGCRVTPVMAHRGVYY